MGLDQYAYAVSPNPGNNNFGYSKDARAYLIGQWRKHPNLQGWMEALYNHKANIANYAGQATVSDEIIVTSTTFSKDELPQISAETSIVSSHKEIQDSINKEKERLKEISASKVRIFNNQPIRLTFTDLDQLETAINRGDLPFTEGFFFGEPRDEEEKENDLAFIERARKAMQYGMEIYYTSWW